GVVEDAAALGGLEPVWRSELARLLPEIHAEGLPAPTDDALRLFEAVGRLGERLAASRPVVLLLEDVHWADAMSLRLLAFLARRTPLSPVVIVVPVRGDEMEGTPALRSILAELDREGYAATLSLVPLSRAETATLVRALARVGSDGGAIARLGEQIWRASEGNPFMVVETMQALDQGTDVPAPD